MKSIQFIWWNPVRLTILFINDLWKTCCQSLKVYCDMICNIRKKTDIMELRNGLQCHWHPNRVSERSRQDVASSYSMWSGFSAHSDRWSGFAAYVFWPWAVNAEVPWLTVCCDRKLTLSVTAQIDWFPNLPRTQGSRKRPSTYHIYVCLCTWISQDIKRPDRMWKYHDQQHGWVLQCNILPGSLGSWESCRLHFTCNTQPNTVEGQVHPVMATALPDGSGPISRTMFPAWMQNLLRNDPMNMGYWPHLPVSINAKMLC